MYVCKSFLGVVFCFNFFGIKPLGIKTLYTLNKCSSLSLSYTALDDHRQKNILSIGLITVDGDLDHLGGLVMPDLSTLKLPYPPVQCYLWKDTVNVTHTESGEVSTLFMA